MPSLPSDPSRPPPILDSAFEAAAANGENNHGDSDQNQWLQRESIPGLKKLRESIKVDLSVFREETSTHRVRPPHPLSVMGSKC
ncbi:hypothetical protein GALMADRAFT_227216 [Galerina marginata CBS 339.88]|uniref:Uncharacterized protein n=1 Tax=Galerina marginata (strain CBS 339.88) TaxID=685588 RepID=A0A067SV85_GALM3|nr:hypothetical protein GALMADRAFT_227216 [Galerina marginata CBS 339.88]